MSGLSDRYQTRKDKFELFVMSEAGKPIYSFSRREDAVTLMPLCSALINYAKKAQKETLINMKTSDNLMVEAQIISILTAKTLKTVFEERPTFDLKRLLYGSEKLIDSIANISISVPNKSEWPWVQAFLAVTSSVPSHSVGSISSNPLSSLSPSLPSRPHRVLIPIVPMHASTRDSICSIMSTTVSSNSKSMVFSLLFRVIGGSSEDAESNETDTGPSGSEEEREENNETQGKDVDFQLISVCNHHNKHKLKITDIHILLALLIGSKAQLSSVESLWMPVCLPRFNRDAFLHSYISYINDMKNCLILLSVDREEFSNCQKARNSIEEKLESTIGDPNQRDKFYYHMSPLVHPVLLELQDKLISNSLSAEERAETQKQADKIYNSKLELYHSRQLQFLWYQTNKQVLWWQRSASRPLSPVLYYITKKMLHSSLKTLWLKLSDDTVFLGWHVPTFQVYTQFDSTITTNEATEVIQRITNWIKKEEDSFSLREYR